MASANINRIKKYKGFNIVEIINEKGERLYFMVFKGHEAIDAYIATEELARSFIDRGNQLGVDWSKYYLR